MTKEWQKKLHKAQKKYKWTDKEMALIYEVISLVQKDLKEIIKIKILAGIKES